MITLKADVFFFADPLEQQGRPPPSTGPRRNWKELRCHGGAVVRYTDSKDAGECNRGASGRAVRAGLATRLLT